MSHPRVFLTGRWADGPLPLSDEDEHHLRVVLRVSAGDEIVAVDPVGRQFAVLVDSVGEDRLSGTTVRELESAWMPQIALVQGVAKNPRMDAVIEKTTELGVSRIVPLVAERCVVRLEGMKANERRARWQRIATAAAKQSRRSTVPPIEVPTAVDDIAGVLRGIGAIVVFDEDNGSTRLADALECLGATSETPVAVVVGPEGGLTESEVGSFESLGAVRAGLGPTILRTETAGAVAVALTSYELGGLGGARRV